MNTRNLLSASALYGVADVLVLVVGGFLLLPLYTRTLSQAEFGAYVIVRANTEILTYVLYLGLLSAVGRLYFDHKNSGRHHAYLSSVLILYALNVLLVGAVIAIWGDAIWRLLSPTTPAEPYIWYCFAIAATGFLSALGSLWLRLDGRATAFAVVQLVASVLLAITAYVDLVVLRLGLPGLLLALLAGAVPPAVVLLVRLGGGFRPIMEREHVAESLRYGTPFVVSYVSYFALNRFSTLVLQRHVPIDQIAIFGLAQQLALLVTIVSNAFGKALQPAVFGAAPGEAPELLHRSSRIFIGLMFCVTTVVVMFAHEMVLAIAPKSYIASYQLLLILVVASFAYSLSLISNTALEYYRRPRTSAAVSTAGAGMSVVFGLVLIPPYRLLGAAIAISVSYVLTMLLGQWMAYRLTGRSYFGHIAIALAGATLLALVAAWIQRQGLALLPSVALKIAVTTVVLAAIFTLYAPKGFLESCIKYTASWRGK